MTDADDARTAPRAEDGPASRPHFFSETIEVIVGTGDSKSAFTVHASVVRRRSTFFESALSGRWDNVAKGIELPEDHPAIFDRYLRCVYRKDARVSSDGKQSDQLDDPSEHPSKNAKKAMLLFAQVYILADKLGDCASANMLIDAVVDDTCFILGIFEGEVVDYIWKHTPARSPLRKLCTASWAYVVLKGNWEMDPQDSQLPHEFLLDVVSEIARVGRSNEVYMVGEEPVRDIVRWQKDRYYQYDLLQPEPVKDEGGWTSEGEWRVEGEAA